MSFVFSQALQSAVYMRLSGHAELAALVGSAIQDAPLEVSPAALPADHITLGEEIVRANDTKTSFGAVHDFNVTIHSSRDGFETAKRIAAAVCDCLIDAPLALSRGRLIGLRFLRAKAERGPAPEKRKISLRFRAVVDQDD